MPENTVSANQAIQNAATAFQRGDKPGARYWAQVAAGVAPQREEPWLILAAVSRPQASIEYLKQALLVNPGSERAMQGLRWAQGQLAKQRATAAKSAAPTSPTIVPIQKTVVVAANTQPVRVHAIAVENAPRNVFTVRNVAVMVVLLALMLTSLAWAAWPGSASFAMDMIRSQVSEGSAAPGADRGPGWSLAAIIKPTHTATQIPTATPTPTPTALPTDIPTPTALPTDVGGSSFDPGPQAGPVSDGGKYILVSISEQHLYAYQDGTLVYSTVASTGMNNSTRVGVFHVLDKIPNAYGSTWNIWMPHWLGIYYSGSLENGIHSLPILANGARLWAGYLGTPISYGCVVLGIEEAQWIYDWAEVGTTVEIKW